MSMNCGYLVQLLRKNITNNKKVIHDYHLYKDEHLDEKQELEKLLFITPLNISTMSFEKIKNIVLGFTISDKEKQEMIEELKVIMTILNLNSIKGTNILLDEVQNEVLYSFLNYLHEYILIRKNYNINNNIDIDELVFINDASVIVKVIDDRHIAYKGVTTSLSALAQQLLEYDYQVQGTAYFSYQGEKLTDLRERMESKK